MEPPFFTGPYQQTLDEKWRLLIPAPCRKQIKPDVHGEAFYLTITPQRRLWLYPDRYFRWLHQEVGIGGGGKRDPDPVPHPDVNRVGLMTLGMSTEIEPDKTGRLVIPQLQRDFVKLDRDVTVMGNGDHLEIWNTKAFLEGMGNIFDRGEEIVERARTVLRGESVSIRTQTITGIGNL